MIVPYFANARTTIYRGDCCAVLRHMAEESVHLVVTSPPYFNARAYGGATWPTYADYLSFCCVWLGECIRILMPGRMLCINSSPVIVERQHRSARSQRYHIPSDLHAICSDLGMWFLEDITWRKPEGSAVNRNQRFSIDRHPLQWRANPTTERIFVYQKPTPLSNDAIIASYGGEERVEGLYERSDVWDMPPVAHPLHPAVFPQSLPARLVQYYSWAGDIVLDPFAGSGTTLFAASGLGRQSIGIEQNATYCEIAANRCAQLTFDL